jgi:hypothetical protein
MYSNFLLGTFKTVAGDASVPKTSDNRIILLLVNNEGEFSVRNVNDNVRKIYPKSKDHYRTWYRNQVKFSLGEFSAVQVQSDTEIAMLLCCSYKEKVEELSLDALKKSLDKLGKYASENKKNVHLNKCERWDEVEPLVVDLLVKRGVQVTVYSQG